MSDETRKDDGGPAFPQALPVEEEFGGSEGMKLRDYFAGQHVSGAECSLPVIRQRKAVASQNACSYAEQLAREAYAVADAMLAERTRAEE
jgi:hypothetical protein